MWKTLFPGMSIPENPTVHTPEWARDFLVEYEAAYDELDDQGQFNPTQIHAMLAKKFFGTSIAPSLTLAKIRALAEGAKTTESSKVVEKVADAATKIVEPRQTSLFEMPPSETTEALHPKTEMQANYEDFEAAYAVQTTSDAKPDDIVFDTVVNGVQKRIAMPYIVAKTIIIPSAKSIRILILQQHLKRYEFPE